MNEGNYLIALTDSAVEGDRELLEQQLNAYNKRSSPHFAALAEAEGKQHPLDVYVRDMQGAIVGGLAGTTYWGWLTIGLLSLDEHLRGQGYGTKLIAIAEAEAALRGCAHSRVTTYSFQACGFYEKMGYRVVGELSDFPPGGAYFMLRKDFDATPKT